MFFGKPPGPFMSCVWPGHRNAGFVFLMSVQVEKLPCPGDAVMTVVGYFSPW